MPASYKNGMGPEFMYTAVRLGQQAPHAIGMLATDAQKLL